MIELMLTFVIFPSFNPFLKFVNEYAANIMLFFLQIKFLVLKIFKTPLKWKVFKGKFMKNRYLCTQIFVR